jgi:predicted secreted protein
LTSPFSWDRDLSLEAPAGEAVLSFGESPTTGYLWRLVGLPPEVEVAGSTYVSGGGMLGGRGERRFTLRARQSGSFTFTAESARFGEPADQRVRVILTAARAWSPE